MDKTTKLHEDLASLRNIMERSNKFLSLSGLSGILAGTFALVGSLVAYFLVYYPHSPFGLRKPLKAENHLPLILPPKRAGLLLKSIFLPLKN